MLKVIATCTIFLWTLTLGFGQDPIFSQYYAAPLQLNPAFVGQRSAPTINSIYRLQWPGYDLPYQTFALSVDQFGVKSKIGYGLNFLYDSAGEGTLNTTKIGGQVGYRLQVGDESYIKSGVELAFIQKRLNWEKLIFFDALDPVHGAYSPGGTKYPSAEVKPNDLSLNYFDLGFGVLFYNEHYYIGVSLDHLNGPVDDFITTNQSKTESLPLRYSVHAGKEFLLEKGNKNKLPTFISPNLLFVQQGDFWQLNAGSYLSYRGFNVGLWYRQSGATSDAIIFSMGIKKEFYTLGYAYDMTLSGLSGQSGGSHELSARFILNQLGQQESKINDCLKLFR